MPDHRITDALRALEPEVPSDATEVALRDVRTRAEHRRRRARVGVVVAAAAAIAVVAGTLAALDFGDDDRRTVVVADPPSESTVTTTTASTTVPSTATTIATETSAPGVGTFDDLTAGVTGLEVTTWWMGPDEWNGLWRADPQLATDLAAAITASEGLAAADLADPSLLRFELSDGRFVFAHVDLETGRLGRVDLETGRPEPTGAFLPEELTRRLRTEFNDAVGRPWGTLDLADPDSEARLIIDSAGFPVADLSAVPDAIEEARALVPWAEYERWVVEVTVEGHGPLVEIRRRGFGDDSVRGVDLRFSLVDTADGWEVSRAEARALCLRGTPGPPPDHFCL